MSWSVPVQLCVISCPCATITEQDMLFDPINLVQTDCQYPPVADQYPPITLSK